MKKTDLPKSRFQLPTLSPVCNLCGRELTPKQITNNTAKKFCSHLCYSNSKRGKNPNRHIVIRVNGKRVYLHRFIIQCFLAYGGKTLAQENVIHHKDDNKQNNTIFNLQIVANQAEHRRLHNEMMYNQPINENQSGIDPELGF